MKRKIHLLCGCLLLSLCAWAGDIVVYPNNFAGDIKPMNAVNNGPVRAGADQCRDNFATYKAAKIPFARTHDSFYSSDYGGPHVVDITAIFPDFSRDVNDSTAYDFTLTDDYLSNIREAGTEVFYRLGQSIEHKRKKYGVMPPPDFHKWAEICEHVIMHYNEGWANGFKWNIKYWEIWNEADLDRDKWATNPQCWGGPKEKFYEFYGIAATYLKNRFPKLKIGGPAISIPNPEWGGEFLAYMRDHQVPLDFFSWHCYEKDLGVVRQRVPMMRELLDSYGYKDSEMMITEWNYVRGWTRDFLYTVKALNGLKGAAFVAAMMSTCQNLPLDMLMYYDARPNTIWNGLFDLYTLAPNYAYYTIYAWSKLLYLGKSLTVKNDNPDLFVTAAINYGHLALLITRYNEDDNVCVPRDYKIRIEGRQLKDALGHITDSSRMFTEIPVEVVDNALNVRLEPNSFIFIDLN